MKMTEINALCTRLKNGTYDAHDVREAAKVIRELITEADEADRMRGRTEDALRELQEKFDLMFQVEGEEELCGGYEED